MPALYWLTQTARDVPRHNRWLSAGERAALSGRMTLKRRADWRLGRWTAKRAVHAYLNRWGSGDEFAGIEILAGGDGAPVVFVDGHPSLVAASISHSGGLGLCALADHGLRPGCDAEVIEWRGDRFAADYFAPEELRGLYRASAGDRALVSTLTWSAKESVLKVLGEGLRRDTRSIVVQTGPITPGNDWSRYAAVCVETARSFHGWWIAARGLVWTLAAEQPSERPIALTASPRVKEFASR